MKLLRRHELAILALSLAFPAVAAAQDPQWELIGPNVTWDNHWKVEPASQPLFSVLDEALYIEERPVVTGDRTVATHPKQRFSIGFSDIDPTIERFAGGQVWIYIEIKKRTRMDFALRTRRDGHVVTLSSDKGVTPPITLAPEDHPVGRNGFRGWFPIIVPTLTGEEATGYRSGPHLTVIAEALSEPRLRRVYRAVPLGPRLPCSSCARAGKSDRYLPDAGCGESPDGRRS